MQTIRMLFVACLVFGVVLLSSDSNAGDSIKTDPSKSARNLLRRADQLFAEQKFDEARELYTQAAEVAEIRKMNSELTEAYAMIARTYLTTDNEAAGKPWIDRAGRISSIKEPLGWSRFLAVEGRFEWRYGQNVKATKTFKSMFEYCKKHELPERAIDAARMAAITGTPEQQVGWGRRGISYAIKQGLDKLLGPLWNNLGATYEEQGKYPEALDAYLKAQKYHLQYGNDINKLAADWAIGRAYRLNDNIDEAEKWLRPLAARSDSLKNDEWSGWVYKELGHLEAARGNFSVALENLRKAKDYLADAGMAKWDAEGFAGLDEQIKLLETKTGGK